MPEQIVLAANRITEAMNAYAAAFIPEGSKPDVHWRDMDAAFDRCIRALKENGWSQEKIVVEVECPDA